MNAETKILGGILIFSLVLIFGAVFLLSKNSNNSGNIEESKVYSIDYSKGEKIGSDSAKVRLVEFSDLQCPACKVSEPFVKQVIDKNNGKSFQFIYRHFPLTQHIHSKKAANFAEYASSEGKFWQIHDKLFETQEDWIDLPDPTDYFVNLGTQFGLDKEKIKQAVTSQPYSKKIDDDIADGYKAAVNATPTFYLNGKKLNLQSFADLDTAVQEELKRN